MWLFLNLGLFSLVTVGVFEMGVATGNWEGEVIRRGLGRRSSVR